MVIASSFNNTQIAHSIRDFNALTRYTVDAAVYNNSPRLHPISLHKMGPPDCHHQNIRLLALQKKSLKFPQTLANSGYFFFEIAGLGMANCNSGMMPFKQLGHWSAHDFAPSQHNSVSAFQLRSRLFDQLQNPNRSAGQEPR